MISNENPQENKKLDEQKPKATIDPELEQIYKKVKSWALSQERVKLSAIVINFDVNVETAKKIVVTLMKEGILENGTATDEGFKVIKR